MAEINLLRRYPRAKRNITRRKEAKDPNNIAMACKFEKAYFDGSRETGYGGYKYDGRWIPIADDFVSHYGLTAGDRILDIGCAKGFLVKDLMTVCPGLEAFGIDISRYALANCEPEVASCLQRGNADSLPFADDSFTLAISINTVHNLDRAGCIQALQEMQRVGAANYVQVDSWLNEEQRLLFLDWMLTAKTYFDPEGWKQLFEEAGYTGDYYWTITE